MKSYRFDFTGGVNVVGDKAVLKETFVTVADNCDLRSGAPRPFRFPQYDHTPPSGTKQIFEYRGKWYYSAIERSYATEYIGGRDRIYFTQYGGNARKIVDGVEVSLGLSAPKAAPIVVTGRTIQASPTLTIIDGGNFGPSKTRSYRIAVETENGVLPPGGRMTITTPPDNSDPGEDEEYVSKGINLEWPRVEDAIRYWVFAGDGADESLLEKVSGGVLSYTDTGTKGSSGDLATNYSPAAPYMYFYTFERFVNGMVDESGPSPATNQVESTVGRTIRFDQLGDGFFSQESSVSISSGITLTDSMTAFPALTITNAEYQGKLNQIKFTTSTPHGIETFDEVRINLTDDPNWVNAKYKAIADATHDDVFYIKNGPVPTSTTGTADICKFTVTLSAAPDTPVVDDDIVYLSLGNAKGYNDIAITYIIGKAKATSTTQFTVDGFIGPLTAAPVTASNLKYVPKNGYIRYRNLYRTGDSSYYQLVKQLPISDTEFVDSVSAANLGDVPDSFYDENGVTVVYAVPPFGMSGVINHYDMLAAIDGHRVRWTVNGRPDAWPADFYYDFSAKPVALASFAQSLIVLCEDAIYRIDGNVATNMSISKTMAEDGCIAPLSVQKTSNGLVYLSKRGLMLFDGQFARCLTDSKVDSNFWVGTSNPAAIDYPIYPTQFGYQYAALCELDGLKGSMDRALLNAPTKPIDGIIKDIDSFYNNGKYYLFWKDGASNNYNSHTCVVIDLQSNGLPITTLSMRIIDACVDSDENVYLLLPHAPATTTVTIVSPV